MSTDAAAVEIELSDSHGQLPDPSDQAPATSESRLSANFGLMALYQIVMRTGWIFKTESIIMPAVLDTIGGPGWLRGCLPMLNRFGQSIPPVLASAHIHSTRQKKYGLAICTCVMGLAFWGLAALWWIADGKPNWWMPGAFLILYGLFFASTGINQLISGTLTGKLIPVVRRGRLMLVASTLGTVSAVCCAAWLLSHWLDQQTGNFFAIFGFTGSLFLAAAVVALLLIEDDDHFPKTASKASHLIRSAAQALAEDAHLRRLAIVSALFGMSLTLFPHYQALGRQRLELGFDSLMPWVITQNIGVALFSVPAGWLADRHGNRLVLRLLLAVVCVAPLAALGLSRDPFSNSSSYTLVFMLLGATPVTIRTLTNYCLELAPRSQQPRYLSTLSLCTAGPVILTAPLLGGLVDLVGFEAIFVLVVACLGVAWLLTYSLFEPRESQ